MRKFKPLLLALALLFGGASIEAPAMEPPVAAAVEHPAPVITRMPVFKVEGMDSTYDIGDMIVLSVSADTAPVSLKQNIKINYHWIILEDGKQKTNVVSWPDNTKLFFPAGKTKKNYTVVLTIDCLFTTVEKSTIQSVEIRSPEPIISTIVVGGEPIPPDPTPNPTPNPTPTPILPDGKFGLAKFAFDTFRFDTTLSQSEKVTLAQALQSSYAGIAGKIAALSNYNDIATILKDSHDANLKAVTGTGIDLGKTAGVKKAFGDKIAGLYKDKKLSTADDFKTAFEEITLGLQSYK